jgi:hypothetical protein
MMSPSGKGHSAMTTPDDPAVLKMILDLVKSPLSVDEIENLEDQCIATLVHPTLGLSQSAAKLLIRMTAEIRRSRDLMPLDVGQMVH